MMMKVSKTHMKMIIKRKRTKRQRPSSASTSSTNTTASETGFLLLSTNSIEFTKIIQQNHEEEMANCLILLAQGQPSASSSRPPPQLNKAATGCGVCVYECKTCNRGFSSFQALGGHRASHKKPPKVALDDKNSNFDLLDGSTTLSLQIGPNKSKSGKVHECSICGAEFTSGQALGGHMRRHRSMPPATTTSGGCQEAKKLKTLISLDLNLPAPSEDDHKETKFPFGSKDEIIVFSRSSLVDCHF